MIGANVRHDIDPALVAEQTERKAASIAAQTERAVAGARETQASYDRHVADGKPWRGGTPTSEAEIRRIHADMIARERDHYARVRVIELPQGEKRFVLAYGDADDGTVTSGTGPFADVDTARAWYLNGGR